jgi:hypothetical protein
MEYPGYLLSVNQDSEMPSLRSGEFDVGALYSALDAQRRSRAISWQQVAREMSGNVEIVPGVRILSPSTMTGMRERGAIEGDGVLGMLRWLRRTPESFLAGRHGNSKEGDTNGYTGTRGC